MNENMEQLALMNEEAFQMLKDCGTFEITPCETAVDLEDKNRFTKLELSTSQKMHMSAFWQQLPSALAAGAMTQMYTVRFPMGLPHTLTALNQGGFGSMLRGAQGQFVGTASFYPVAAQAAMLGVFTTMSVASGQYFLAQINNEMKMMTLKLDKILEFLYGDKKAELMAEISFIKYAYQNYNSIMSHEQQREATIISLQSAKKVAMKDLEFYMVDLDSTVNADIKNYSELEELSNKAFQIRDSLELSMQLYSMSNLLEMYYAQNQDPEYLEYLEGEMTAYIDKYNKRMLSSFSVLNRRIGDYKSKIGEKVDKSVLESKVGALLDSLNSGEESPLKQTIHSALNASTQQAEYYLGADGNVYVKNK